MELKKDYIFIALIIILILILLYQHYSFNKSLETIKHTHQPKITAHPVQLTRTQPVVVPQIQSIDFSSFEKKPIQSVQKDQSSSGKVTYYFSPGCGHCVNFSPEWDKFHSKYNMSPLMKKIDCSVNPELCTGVQGVPFVVFSKNGKDVVYSGARTADALHGFYSGF